MATLQNSDRDIHLLQNSGSGDLFPTLEDCISMIDFSGEEELLELFPDITFCGETKKHSRRKNKKRSTAPKHRNMKKAGRGVSSALRRLSKRMEKSLVLREKVSDLLVAEYNKASTSCQETCDSQMWDDCVNAEDLEQYLNPEFSKMRFPEFSQILPFSV